MFHDDEVSELYGDEVIRGSGLYKDPESGVWTDEAEEDFGDGFSDFRPYPSGDSYESDRYDPQGLDSDEAAGWLAYNEGQERDASKPAAWLDGYDLAASSGLEPYTLTQERMKLQELRDELGPVDDFLREVQTRLDAVGASQTALAREMGLPQQNVSRWMRGVVEPTLESMLAMRDALETLEAS